MNISPTNVEFNPDTFAVSLSDGRILHVPLAWFPRLLKATPIERSEFELSHSGIHWEALDEDISVEGLLAGRGDQTGRFKAAA